MKAPLLWKAASENDIELCINLLEDPSIDADETHKLWTPLMKAAEEGHVEVVQMLLDRGADIKAMNKKGRDALSFAAAPSIKRLTNDKHLHVLRLLVERGADPHHKDEARQTAKERARVQGNDAIVAYLEELERSNDLEGRGCRVGDMRSQGIPRHRRAWPQFIVLVYLTVGIGCR